MDEPRSLQDDRVQQPDDPDRPGIRRQEGQSAQADELQGRRDGRSAVRREHRWADTAGIAKDKQIQFPDLQTSLAALQADRVDAISNNVPAIADALSKLNDPNLELAVLTEQPAGKSGVASLAYSSFGFRKEDQDLVDAFDAFVKDIKANGKLLELLKPYGMGAESIPSADQTKEKICAG